MSAPIDLGSDGVHALLARLRAAQNAGGTQDAATQNGAPSYQFPSTVEQEQKNGTPSASHTTYGTSTVFPGQSVAPGSVQSLLSSLQNARRPEYPAPAIPTPTYMSSGYQPTNTYQPPPSAGQQYNAPRQPYSYPDAQRPVNTSYATPYAPPPYREPPRNQPSPQPPRRSTPPHVARPIDVPFQPVPVERTRSPPRVVHMTVPAATKSAAYDPYDEDFDLPEEAPQPPDEDDAMSDPEDDVAPSEKEDKDAGAELGGGGEDQATRLKRERNEDAFVNMSFGKASMVVTRLLSNDSVLRRLKAMKEEQDKMERTLWQKRLDIVKAHREKINKAKEQATKLDSKTGEARILKERAAAKRALNQFYTSRCLPFYDDLHRKHLSIMQEELGIPGLGRLETRRKNNPGGAERPIAIDSDEEDDAAEEQEVFDAVVGAVAEEEREKMLARRKKIMDLIESIMSDGGDD